MDHVRCAIGRVKSMDGARALTAALLVGAFALSGCVSATPRSYAPLVRPPPVDAAAFERDFAACASTVAMEKRNFGQSGKAVVAGAVGGAAAVPILGGAAAASQFGNAGTALAASGLGLVMLVPAMTYSLSASRRRRNEQAIQQAMTACLAQNGHTVAAWSLVPRGSAAPTTTLTPTQPGPPAT